MEGESILQPQSATVRPKKRILLIVLLLLLFLITNGGSFLFGMSIKKTASDKQITTAVSPTIASPSVAANPTTIEPTPIIASITDINTSNTMKTYTNSVHKYSVQYPPGWTIDLTNATKVALLKG